MSIPVLDNRLLTQKLTADNPILAMRHLLFFPEVQHEALSATVGDGFDPRGIWFATGNISDVENMEPGPIPSTR